MPDWGAGIRRAAFHIYSTPSHAGVVSHAVGGKRGRSSPSPPWAWAAPKRRPGHGATAIATHGAIGPESLSAARPTIPPSGARSGCLYGVRISPQPWVASQGWARPASIKLWAPDLFRGAATRRAAPVRRSPG